MHAAIRSPLLAGVTLVGASAIAVTPIAPMPPLVHLSNVALTLRSEALENPIIRLTPLVNRTLDDTATKVNDLIANPAPIARALLSNLVDNGLTLLVGVPTFAPYLSTDFVGINDGRAGIINAALVLAAAGFDTPGAVLTAFQQLLGGDPQGALQTLESVTLLPARQAAGEVIRALRTVVQNEVLVVQSLLTDLPAGGAAIATSMVHALFRVARATVNAFVDIVTALGTGDPVQVWNAMVDGVVRIGWTAEKTLIGNPPVAVGTGGPFGSTVDTTGTANSLATERVPIRSVAATTLLARARIAADINGRQLETANATAAAATGSQSSPVTTTGTPSPQGNVVTTLQVDVGSLVKGVTSALGGGKSAAKKTAAK